MQSYSRGVGAVNSILVLLFVLSPNWVGLRSIVRSANLKSGLLKSLSILLITLAIAGCSGGMEAGPTPVSVDTVKGLIRNVVARSPLELETLDVEDEKGTLWKFEARGKRLRLFTPSHLNEHMVLGIQVTVIFHSDDGAHILDDVID